MTDFREPSCGDGRFRTRSAAGTRTSTSFSAKGVEEKEPYQRTNPKQRNREKEKKRENRGRLGGK